MPDELKESLLYRLINTVDKKIPKKYTKSDGLVSGDKPYLEQFLGEGELMPTDMRPSALNANDNLPWYRPKSQINFPITTTNPGSDYSGTARDSYYVSTPQIDAMKQGDVMDLGYRNFEGVGHAKLSLGKDEKGPYASIYDKWDFDSPVIHPVVGKILGMMGKPYHVYDRYRLAKSKNLNGEDFYETESPHDIELHDPEAFMPSHDPNAKDVPGVGIIQALLKTMQDEIKPIRNH